MGQDRDKWSIYQSLGLGSYVLAGLAGYYIGGFTVHGHVAGVLAPLLAGVFIGLSTWKLRKAAVAALLTGVLGPGLLFLARLLDAPNMARLTVTGAMLALPLLYEVAVTLVATLGVSILWWELLGDRLRRYYS